MTPIQFSKLSDGLLQMLIIENPKAAMNYIKALRHDKDVLLRSLESSYEILKQLDVDLSSHANEIFKIKAAIRKMRGNDK